MIKLPELQGDLDDLLNAFPYLAMVVDDRHNVVAANSWVIRETDWRLGECPISCFPTVHDASAPPSDCPLVESIRTGQPAERDLAGFGQQMHVEVFPLDKQSAEGHALFLHLTKVM